MGLKISKNMTLPDDAVTQTFALLARRGAGKTYAASVLAEEMLKQGTQIVWIDPIGVAWGLRSKYPVLILGGEHADVPLEPTAGKFVADFIVSDRVSAILDIGLFLEGEMRRFVADFATEFYRRNRDPIHLFVDEADEFAPQSGMNRDSARCLGAMQNVVRRGRARGIGVTLITQRSAVLSKSVLTQTECLIAMQTTGPHDLKAIRDWLEYNASTEEKNEIMQSLSKMQQGEAYVYSPGWLKTLKRIQFRKRETFDSSATPKSGEKKKAPKNLAEIDLDALKGQMADTLEKAKGNDPTELKKEVARLKRELSRKPAAEVDQSQIERAVNKALTEQDREWRQRASKLENISKLMVKRLEKISELSRLNGEAPKNITIPEVKKGKTSPIPQRPTTKPIRQPLIDDDPSSPEDWFNKSHQKIVNSIAWLDVMGISPANRSLVAAIAGVSHRSSGYLKNVSRLSSGGLIDYPQPGELKLTDRGTSAASFPDSPGTNEEVQNFWRNSPALNSVLVRLLDQLIDVFPESLSRDDLAERADVSPKSSGYLKNVSRLSSLGLAEYPQQGYVQASENLLFPILQ